jgi:hypothetical protein
MAKGSWILLDSVVYDYLSESEQSEAKFFKLWNIAFRGMEDLGIDFFYQIKSVMLPISSTKTIKLPDDYSSYSKLGVLNNLGEIIPFAYNSSLTLFQDSNPNRLTSVQNDSYYTMYNPVTPCFYNYWDGYGFGNLYGIPSGGYKATFRIDEPNQQIILDPSFTYANVVLEYIALPKEGESYYLPTVFRQALISWISWNDISSAPLKRAVNIDKRERERRYYNDRRLAKARYKPFHLQEAYEWNLQNQRLTVKV